MAWDFLVVVSGKIIGMCEAQTTPVLRCSWLSVQQGNILEEEVVIFIISNTPYNKLIKCPLSAVCYGI